MEDSRIVALFFERSEQAVTRTKEKYGGLIRGTAFRILNDHRDAEECEADTYLAAWNRIPPARPDPLGAYLCRIARNKALNRLDEKGAKKRGTQFSLVLDELEGVIPGKGVGPARQAELSALTEAIEAFLEPLQKEDRVLFVRRYWFAERVKDIAGDLHLEPHAAAVRLSRIRERLRDYLRKEGWM